MRFPTTAVLALLACSVLLPAQSTNYYTPAEIEAEIDALVASHPTRALKVNLSTLPGGQLTHEGRPIWALKISDNVAVDEDEPAFLMASQHHARELNAPVMTIGAMGRVLNLYGSDPAIQSVVDNYELYFVPTVNPDGVNHVWSVYNYWRKNRRVNGGGQYGVDLNRNYPFLWGLCGSSSSTSSDTYRGPSPGSEPETVTMRNLVARLRPEVYIDIHSYGREVLRTYAPCASVSSTIAGLIERYVDDLRNPMGYAKRNPSASGEAPEDHWSHGTMSFLIEVGTSFQPSWSSTVAEEVTVWPGIRRVLTDWRPAVRGHVRSSLNNAPLLATITYSPNVFNHGETCESRARDGRYGLWLPLGSWNVTYAAPGHQSVTVPVSVTSYDNPTMTEVVLSPNGTAAVLSKTGAGNLGTNVNFTYTSPGDAGKLALFGWSLGTSPGINLGGTRVLPLNADFLFSAALSGNAFLAPTWVALNGSSQGNSTLMIPNAPYVLGFTTWFAGITFDPAYHAGVKTWSNAISVTPIP